MFRDPDQVVVMPAGHSIVAVHSAAVHHRDFPEVRGEGDSPEEAATRLAELLARAMDSAPSDWRRESIARAIEDVRAFSNRDRG